MKNISIGDEKETMHLYSGKILGESDLNPIERIFRRLVDKIAELERNVPTPEGTRLNILEHSHDTLWKAHVEAKKILDEMKTKVSGMSGMLTLNQAAHARMFKQIDTQGDTIERLEYEAIQEKRAGRKRDKRISDIEEFLGDF